MRWMWLYASRKETKQSDGSHHRLAECEGCAKKLDPSGYDAGKQIKGRMRQSWSTRWIFAEGGYAGEEKMGLVLHPSCDYSHHAQTTRCKYLLMNPTSRWVSQTVGP
jgi:hypothetical protein